MAWTKAKTAAVAGAVLILAAGTTIMMVRNPGDHSRVKLPPTPANEELLQQENMARMTQAKQWALAFIMFADDHGNQLPKNFEQALNYVPGLSESNWEIVSGGDFSGSAKPDKTILLREKEPRQSPDGPFFRVYAFMDGHTVQISSPTDDFAALEKQRGYLVQSPKN